MCLGHGTKNKVSDQFIFAKSKWIFSSLLKDYTNKTEHRMVFFYQPEYLFKGSGFL